MNPETNKPSRTASVLSLALVRLTLLVVPEILAVEFTRRSPVICVLVCLGILALWFSVDFGPFRAEPVLAKATVAKPAPAKAPDLVKVQNASYLFCKVVLFAAMFQSRMAHWH